MTLVRKTDRDSSEEIHVNDNENLNEFVNDLKLIMELEHEQERDAHRCDRVKVLHYTNS